MMELRRTYRFCASHRLFREDWSTARNLETFGPASREGGHGHNYRFTLVLSAAVDDETGRALDVEALDRRIQHAVLDPLDHRNLNVDVPGLLGVVPTAERIVMEIHRRVLPLVAPARLVQVILQQDEFLSVAYGAAEAP